MDGDKWGGNGAQLAAANNRRRLLAARSMCARVEQALADLGDDAPEHLAAAGHLRLAHPRVSLERLGQLADPPLSKDAVAGSLRRLFRLADRHAATPPR